MSASIAHTRERLFLHLAHGRLEVPAVYLKAWGPSPATVARMTDGRISLLLTQQQLQAVRDRLDDDDGLQPNVFEQLANWFADDMRTLRSESDPHGRGLWVSTTAAAIVYRYLYSEQDYSSTARGGTSINGYTEFGFGDVVDGQVALMAIPRGEVEAIDAWLDSPVGVGPVQRVSVDERPATRREDSWLLPNQRAQLVAWLQAGNGMTPDEIDKQLAAFRERFPLERWRRLSGRDLLMEMHGRDTHDSLVYWLEFKKDAIFQTRVFGSIAGGSSFKFGLFWSASEGEWRSGAPSAPHSLSESEAIALASHQRDELLAAVDCVRALSLDAGPHEYNALQDQIQQVAPDHHHLAFFHKFVYLYAADRLDDFHSLTVQRHVITQLGLPMPQAGGLFAGAGPLVSVARELRQFVPELRMRNVTAALNAAVGSPVDHWRVGTGENGEHWPMYAEHGVVAIGWDELGDLADVVGAATGHAAVTSLREALLRADPDRHKGQATKDARQLWAFYGGMKEGDRIYAAYGKKVYGVGEVTGPYRYEAGAPEYRSRRPVRWLTDEPFESPTTAGLRTTVHRLTSAHAVLAAGARHMDAVQPPAQDLPRRQMRVPFSLGPVGQQLERKGQVVLYGPPGTGKTYHALKVAESLVAQARGTRWAELSPDERAAMKGEGEPREQRIWVCSFHPAYGYEDFVEGLKPSVTDAGALAFVHRPAVFRRLCEQAARFPDERFVLVIDEFNRGDAPRIFGELLTLLELDKRERVRVELPLSGDRFTVPRNVRILATMNTADRSISLLDAAMRRRFAFVEYLPEPSVLDDQIIDGLYLPALLDILNERLLAALGQQARNLQIGHAYLMAESRPLATVRALRSAVRYDIFPLLEEYCSDNPEALGELLGNELYDAGAARFRDELMATGREADFLDILMSWAPERLGRETVEALEIEVDDT